MENISDILVISSLKTTSYSFKDISDGNVSTRIFNEALSLFDGKELYELVDELTDWLSIDPFNSFASSIF